MSDFESRLLAKLLTPADVIEAQGLGMRRELFEMPLYGDIYDFIVDYFRSSKNEAVPTPFALTQKFPGYVHAEGVKEEVWWLTKMMRKRHFQNRLQSMIRTAAKDSTNPEDDAEERATRALHDEAYAALEVAMPRVTRTNMADNIEERLEYYKRKSESPHGLGVTYGLDMLDQLSGGILPGEIAVVAAFAKTGKTMLLLNAAAKALRKGYRPVVYSLELSLQDTQERLDAMWSGVSYDRLSRGYESLTEPEQKTLDEALVEWRDLGGIPVERPEPGDRTVGYLCSRTREIGCDYMIIDQLSKLEPGHRTDTIKERRASVITQLKIEASRAGSELPTMIAHQLRREDAEEPSLSSLAEAAEIEREVDMVLAIYRNSDMRLNHKMAAKILGSRRTDHAEWLLDWELQERTNIATLRHL